MIRFALVLASLIPAGHRADTAAAIRATWPDNLEAAAIRVADCESTLEPTARNGQYRGIFQMGRQEWRDYGMGDVWNAWDNSAAAYRLFRARGWQPWQCRWAA